MTNPLLSSFDTKFQLPPFSKIESDHYLIGIETSLEEAKQEVDQIIKNTEEPTFQNTIEALESAGWAVNPFPLIWFKDRGLIPDAKRGPRRVYETALMANLGDRKVIKSVPNVFYHKVEKQGHISTKPQMMLQHFFQMFVDDLTELFDPTCGSGMALAAGKVLGAKRIAGMDIEEEYIETTKMNIRKADRRSQQSGQE